MTSPRPTPIFRAAARLGRGASRAKTRRAADRPAGARRAVARVERGGFSDGLADAEAQRRGEARRYLGGPEERPPGAGAGAGWDRSVAVRDSDGRWRRVPADAAGGVEPALFPLVDAGKFRNRVGLLRGSGNAIVAALAAAFIRTCDEWLTGVGE